MNPPSDEPSPPRDPGAISESAGAGSGASRDATPAEEARALEWLRGILAGEGPLVTEDKRTGREKLRRLLEQEDVADLVLEILEEVGSEEALTPEGAGEAPAASSERPEMTARPVGRTLGDYRLLRFLGKGGMGVVYEAEQLSLGRRVALKILPRHSLMEPSSLKRFQLEARAAAKLSHPHIVPVHDTGVAEGMHYYAMHLVEGEGLDRVLEEVRLLQTVGSDASRPPGGQRDSSEHPAGVRLAREFLDGAFPAAPDGEHGKAPPGALLTGDLGSRGSKGLRLSPGESPSRATEGSSSSSRWAGGTDLPPTSDSRRYFRAVARVGLQAASALACAHGQGILHRDIKPSNLLLDVEGKVWVADFGLAKAAGGEDLTQTGEVVGSLRYMAPERFRGFSDHRSDVYGLGATLYELCMLRPAFGAADRAALVHQILHREPARPRRIDPRIPRNLETIILKALEKEPHHRYQSAQELHDDLARFLAERPIAARKLSASERSWLWCRRNPLAAALALAVAAILAAGGIGSFLAALHFRDLAGSLARQKQATNEQLWSARVAQARSERQGQRIGQRESSLSAIVQAAEIRQSLELRDEAIAALGLVDLKPVWKIDLPVSPGSPFAFDPRLRRYAFADGEGAIHVCDVGGGEVAVFGGILDHSSRAGSPRPSNSSDTSKETGAAKADAAGDSRDLPNLRFSPDGRFLLVHGSSDGWALAIEERERYSFAWSLPLWQQCVDWSADGRLLAIAGHSNEDSGREIVLVDMKDAREVLRVATGSQAVLALRFSPDGQAVAVATHGEILLLRIAGGSLESWLPQQAVPNSFDWDPRGRLLACAGSDGPVRLWDLESRTVRETFSGAHDKRRQVFFDPTGRFLVTTAAGELNSLWDLRSSSLALRFSGEGLVWGPEGRMGRRVGATAEILEVVAEEEYRCLFQSGWKGAEARSLALSRDGSLVAWSSFLGIRLWDLEGSREITKLPSRTIPTSLFSDGAGLVVATPLSRWLWPIREVREGPEDLLQIGPPRPWAPAAPAGALALAHHRSGLYLHEQERPEDGILLRVPIGAEDTLASARVSPDRSWAAAVTRGGGEVFVWNLDRKRPVAGIALEIRSQAAKACDFSSDSRWLVITCEAAYEFVRKDSREVFARIPRDPGTSSQPSAAFSEDGTVAAVLISGSTIGLVDMNEGEVVAHFSLLGEFSGASPSCLQLSPDGTQLAAGARGGSVHVWDLSKIRERLESFGLAEGFPRMAPQRRSRALPLRTRVASGTWMKDLKGKSVNPVDLAGSESTSGGLEARIAEAIEKRLRESDRP